MPGARWFPGAELNYAEHIFRGKRDDEVAVAARLGAARARRAALGRAPRAGRRAWPAGLRELGVERGDRVVAYLPERPRGADRLPGHRVASARSGRAARPTSAPRASSTASRRSSRRCCSRRRLPLRRQGLRPPRDRRRARSARCRRSSAPSSSPTSTPSPDLSSPATSAIDLGRAARRRRGRRARLRAGALRPPALGPLLLGHHRPAEGDRPRPRRHPARAPEEAPPAPRRAGPATASSGSPPPAG